MEPLADAVRCAPKWLKSSIAKFREEGISLLYGLSVNAENAYSFRSSSAHHCFPWRSPYSTSRPLSGGALVPGVVWTVSGSTLLAWITLLHASRKSRISCSLGFSTFGSTSQLAYLAHSCSRRLRPRDRRLGWSG